MSEVKITVKINILETLTIISFCLGITSIIYFLINVFNAKMEWSQSNVFILSGISFLLTSTLINKWANYELQKLYKENS